jgi:hypothetical protein
MRTATTYDEMATAKLTIEEITSKNIKLEINAGRITATEKHRDYVWITDGRNNY